MTVGRGAARLAALLVVVALVAVAGWGSWQNRRDRVVRAPTGTAETVEEAAGATASAATVAPVPVAVPVGCWAQTGVATDPAAGVGERVSLRYCLGSADGSTMTLSQGERVRCEAAVLAEPVGERLRIAMAREPSCAFGPALPRFDALCNPPDGERMTCDIDWGEGLVETFRLGRS